ncbi:MAG: 2,3-bisphosphoglycerate-independent phosphoglycerate mutase [Candidatus Aenigmarchaeota archaeon]|nr:2,3-bisphosphoglycerate-independent phosphoglycerate mutase [Candidatus Aenigmarchaeota archaeon]
MNKIFFVVLDGIADNPLKDLGWKTPLECAKKPFLNKLSEEGVNGSIMLINKSIPPQTETGVLSLLGFNPLNYNTGRGPLEAVGMGLRVEKNDLVLRGNLATAENGYIIDTEAGRISGKKAEKIIGKLKKIKIRGIKIKIYHSLGYRFLLFLKSKKLSPYISSNHPGYERNKYLLEYPRALRKKMKIKKIIPLKRSKDAQFTADVLNKFIERAKEILKDEKTANYILLRGANKGLIKLTNLPKKYGGKWICLGDTPVERGISKLVGMDIARKYKNPETDKLLKTFKELKKAVRKDCKRTIKKLKSVLSRYDFFYIHLKGADAFGHKGMPLHKKKIIEYFDLFFFKPLTKLIKKDDIIIVTADHTTSCRYRTHTADPVPVLIFGDSFKPDKVKIFAESQAKRGRLGRFKAKRLIKIVCGDLKCT